MLRKVGLLGAVASAAAFTAPATLPLRASSNVASSARPLRAGAAAVEMVDAGAVAAAVPGLVALGVVLQNNAAAPAPAAAAPATSPTPADMPTIATARVCFCRCPSPSLPPCARCEMHFAKRLRQGDRLRLPSLRSFCSVALNHRACPGELQGVERRPADQGREERRQALRL